MNGRQDIKGLDENGYRMLSGIRNEEEEDLMDHQGMENGDAW